MTENWLDQFPALSQLPQDAAGTLINEGEILSLPCGQRVFGPGMAAGNYLLLLSGSVRVHQLSENGREIVLFRIAAGESCALTTACIMSNEAYTAEATVEEDARAVAISRETFDDLVARSPEFRRFVFSGFSQRVTGLFRLVEEIAFERMEIRLAQKLIALADSSGTVSMTHQQLAVELGSAREVISRQLAEFQRRGWVESGRGQVTLTDRSALKALVHEPH